MYVNPHPPTHTHTHTKQTHTHTHTHTCHLECSLLEIKCAQHGERSRFRPNLNHHLAYPQKQNQGQVLV